jgi:Zn-dependent protease with chaperone function
MDGADLTVSGDGIELRFPFSSLHLSERLGSAPRRIAFPDGGYCEISDLERLDELLALTEHREGFVERWQRHLPVAIAALLAVVAVLSILYRWGLPWAAGEAARYVPASIVDSLSQHSLAVLDGSWFWPSKLPEARRQQLAAEFEQLRRRVPGGVQAHLVFRASPTQGANALTFPGGTVVLLDGLVTVLGDDGQIMAVLAHELGHARAHHPMQLLLQRSALAAFWALYVGDASSLLATAPTVLLQARYSRQLEQQADDFAARLLVLDGLSPTALADALQKLAKARPPAAESGYLDNHPAIADRIRRLRERAPIT